MPYTDIPDRSSRRPSAGSQADPFRGEPDTRRTSQLRIGSDGQVAPQTALPHSPAGLRNDIPQAYIAPENIYSHRSEPEGVYHNTYLTDYPHTDDSRRGSDDSNATLNEDNRGGGADDVTFSSYRHPYDIQPPPTAVARGHDEYSRHFYLPTEDGPEEEMSAEDIEDIETMKAVPADERRRGLFANILQLHGMDLFDEDDEDGKSVVKTFGGAANSSGRPWGFRRIDSLASESDQIMDPDDPAVTGTRKASQDDPEDIEKNVLRGMNYRDRRKEKQRMRIELNITSVHNRQLFLMKLAKALMVFGAPSHRIESQLLSAARILEVDAEYVNLPGIMICSFGDHDTKTSDTHFVKCGGRLSLGALHQVHQIYRAVVHDEISAKKATKELDDILMADPVYNIYARCVFAFLISSLICPLAFGGSIADMWFAGIGGIALCLMHFWSASKSQIYATVFEITITVFISFMARGLSSIPSQKFCYTAISSAGIVSILPGYLILTSSLELASKNIVCGSIKMVYALIYTLFIGYGLNLGSDFYLLFDESQREELKRISDGMVAAASLSGNFIADNTSTLLNDVGAHMFSGQFTFSNTIPVQRDYINTGCYRPPSFAWYLQPFPWWTEFIIVPLFSILSSLSNLQPWRSVELIVMVVISCISYAANKGADFFIFQRSDVVSAIGAFVIGLLGNVYSRKMGGTAFTSMVTGVLFLVPSGLSASGGITAQGNGIEIGNAMVAVTIGITVGLFMSQSFVYMFGSKKNAAIFSF